MNLPDLAFKASASFLGIATLVLGADLVSAMTQEAIFGKAPTKLLHTQVHHPLKLPLPQTHKQHKAVCSSAHCCTAASTLQQHATSSKESVKVLDDGQVVIRPPWLAEGQGKAKRLFLADQGASKRVISLARDQTIKTHTSAEFKDRLADVLCLLPELPLSTVPPGMLHKLVVMSPGAIAEQLVLLRGLFTERQDINELLLKEPTLLTTPYSDTALHFQRLRTLLESPRKRGGDHPYTQVDFHDFVATYPEFLVPGNVVSALRSLRQYLGKVVENEATVKDFVTGNPGMLLKGYRHTAYAAARRMSAQDKSFQEWWL